MLTSVDKSWHTPLVSETPGERLDTLMRAAGHTRKSLAQALGVHVNTLANWIGGDYSPRDPQVRERLAEEIGADVYATYVVAGPAEADVVDLSELDDERFLALFHAELTRRLSARDGQLPAEVHEYPMSAGVTAGKDQATEGKTEPERTTVRSSRKGASTPGAEQEERAQ